MRTLKLLLVVAYAMAVLSGTPAGAGILGRSEGGSAGGTADGGYVDAWRNAVHVEGAAGGQGGVVPCFASVFSGDAARQSLASIGLDPGLAVGDEPWAFWLCDRGTGGGNDTYEAAWRIADGPLLQVLIDKARDYLVVPAPVPALSPPADVPHLVGMAEWLAVDPGSLAPIDVSVSVPGVTVTLTATPVASIWDPGDGTAPFGCDLASPAWSPGAAAPSCTHTYQWSSTRLDPAGTYTASVSTLWELAWACEPGCGDGTLPPVTRATTYDLLVRQGQAVITGPPGA